MSNQWVKAYLRQFGNKYLNQDIFAEFPEAKIIPAYLRQHFADAAIVLDLGFGAGLWFWASFLPNLKRIDGFDLYPEALAEAARVFDSGAVPIGYQIAHAQLGEEFTLRDLRALKNKRG